MTEIKRMQSLINDQEQDLETSFNCYKAVKEAKADVRDNIQILESVCDSLNTLCVNLNRLDNLTENIFFGKDKEKGK